METTAHYKTAPEKIVLRKLTPTEKTEPGDSMLCDGHLHPICLYGTDAGEFAAVIYRQEQPA